MSLQNGVLGALDVVDALDSAEGFLECSDVCVLADDECYLELHESECNGCDLGVGLVELDSRGDDRRDLLRHCVEVDLGVAGEELVDLLLLLLIY